MPKKYQSGGRLPSGETAEHVLTAFLAISRAYLPYLSEKDGLRASLHKGRLPVVQVANIDRVNDQTGSFVPMAMTERQMVEAGDFRPVVSLDAGTSSSKISNSMVHEFTHPFEGWTLERFPMLTKDAQESIYASMFQLQIPALSYQLGLGRQEGKAEFAASLLTKDFFDTVYEKKYGTHILINTLLETLDSANSGNSSSPEALTISLNAHFKDDKESVKQVLSALSDMSKQPEYKDYKFLPIHKPEHGSEPLMDLQTALLIALGAASLYSVYGPRRRAGPGNDNPPA